MGASNQKQQTSSKVATAIPSQLMAVYKFRTAACASASSASSLRSAESASYKNISNDCLLYVASFLTVSDWGTIARVSKNFHSLIDSNENWNLFCHSQFPKCDFLHHQALLGANDSTFSMKHFFSNDLVPILLQANNQTLPLQMNNYSDINPVSSWPSISYVDKAFDLMIEKKLLCETNYEAMSLILKHCHFLGPQALVNYLGMYDCTSEVQQDDSSQKRLIERFNHVTSFFFANEFCAYKKSVAQAQAHLMSLLSLENHFLHVLGPSLETTATCVSDKPLYYYLNSQQVKNIQLLFAKYYGEQCYPTLMQMAKDQAEKIKLQSTSTANMYKYFFQDEQLRKAMVAEAHSCANFTIEEWEAGKLNSEQWVTDAKLVLLHTVLPLLGMRQHIGDAIGDAREHYVAKAYMSIFTLRGMFLPNALTLVFNSMTLPGEAQKIDRVCDFFAQAYVKSNNSAGAQDLIPFLKSSEPIYVMSYGIIMLNTDYQVNKQNGMKLDEFIMNNLTVNDFGDFPEEYLANIYWHVVNSRVL